MTASKSKGIVITSYRENFDLIKNYIRKKGFVPVFFPAIGIKGVNFSLPERTYGWVAFTSKNAVTHLIRGAGRKCLKGMKIAAIGGETAKALKKYGIKADYMPRRFDSEAFVREFPEKYAGAGERMLLPGSDLSGHAIKKGLEKKGMKTDRLTVYKTFMPAVSARKKAAFMKGWPYFFTVFSSPSAYDNFAGIMGKRALKQTMLAAIGRTTAERIIKRGLKVSVVPGKAGFREIIDAISRFQKEEGHEISRHQVAQAQEKQRLKKAGMRDKTQRG